ncbi:hypothetical protein K2173_025645 [Erythroxylum novogranatense]|uniref:NAB domain-containing protein n=1 Tax=Erythroxylum novogranatense TaxID=1862640 RepID=A0AAV8SBM4_9ROSI|nr:hypothetical protein K2173_025645 [Erythroxylum novogranatense]
MGTVSEANSKRKYSWWWDSHISPKNSKWLQENLTDMDAKVKQMIKLIEEDADSFARRAEMYYKKRPELMKLVEEFYRAYRALAERYDHATGVLRQAHRTMAEAFPNQIPFVLTDESPTGPLADGDPRTPDLSSIRAFVDPDELQSDALGSSSSIFHTAKRSGAFTDESDTGAGRKGLRQLSDSLGSGQVVNHSRFAEGRVRKGLNFSDPEEGSHDLKAQVPSESERVGKAEQEIVTLKNALAKLQAEKEAGLLQYQESLERLSKLESEVSRAKEDSIDLNDRASKAESEVQTLKLALGKVEAEREASYLQYQQCLDKIANLENSVSLAQKDAGELTERASEAETETQSLKEDITRLESEKDAALLQLKQSLDMISDLREKLRLAEEEAKRSYERAEEAEREIEILKQALAELINQKETASAQYEQCLERISLLEHKLACAEEEVGRLESELDDGVAKFKGAEERCLLLETSNQTMHSELESISQRVAAQTEELTEKQKEMGRLWTCIQEEHLRFVEAETAFQTLQHLHSKSQEELRSMAIELQNRAQISGGLETRNHILQNELAQVKVENKGLSEVNLSSTLTIQNLQGEISSLRETIGKLEAEVELRVDQRNALQQEIYCLKEEINELNKKHLAVMNQVESIGYSSESFGSSVKNLQEENTKLKGDLEKERSENEALLEKLENMEKLIAKNAVLENSLSDLNVELEELRKKLKSLEESYQFLLADKEALASEKTTLVSQLLVATEHLEKVMEKNLFLENSLLDANAELESLRLKLKSLEELYKGMQNEKSDLVIAKGSLISELDSTQKRLEDSEKIFRELTDNYYNLEKDKNAILDEVQELRVSLDAQKKEYASLAQFSDSQLASMASKICLLEEEVHHRIKKYEDEVERGVNSQIEIFILQRWVRDMEEKNISLLLQYQKLLEASKLSDKLISELESEKTAQKAKVQSLFDQIKTLKMGLYRVIRTLEPGANQWYEGKAEQDLLNYVVDKIEETEELLVRNEQLVIENSVLVSLLGELQIEVANLVTAKDILDQELTSRMEQQLVLQGESQKLVELNAGLQVKVTEGQNKEDVLRDKLKNLQGQLLDSELSHKNMLEENSKMLSEQRLLMHSLSTLKAEKCNLEEEICASFCESVSQGIHYSLLRDIIIRKSLEVEKLIGNLDERNYTNYDLKRKVEIMESKLEKLSSVENENAALQKMVENLKCKCGEVEVIRADQERQLLTLSRHYDEQSREVLGIHEENKKLEIELCKFHEEYVVTKSREDNLNHELRKERDELKEWESQATALFGELQISAVTEAILEEKVRELVKACELNQDRDCSRTMEIDQLKETVRTLEGVNEGHTAHMTAIIPVFNSLRDSVTSLESHTLPHENCAQANGNDEKDDTTIVHTDWCQQLSEGENAMLGGGLLALQEMQMKIRAIENAVMEKERHLMVENINANSKLEAAMRQIEKLKSRSSLHRQGSSKGKHANPRPEVEELESVVLDHLRTRKQKHEISEEEVMTKDIILDQISDCSPHGISRKEADNQMLEIWEATNKNGNIGLTVGKSQKAISSPNGKKQSRRHPSSDSLVEKEVNVDKLEISKRFSGSFQETSERKVLERLDSDAQKLANLQITVHDLRRKLEITEKSKKGKGFEFDSLKEQLEESEETIMRLFEFNRKLIKSIEDNNSISFNEETSSAPDENATTRRRKVSEQARRVSEKIGRLQLEVQKLQFLLLKLDDENKSSGKTRIIERKTRVLLRDYLYGGTRTSQKRKKGHFCSCVQPPTSD